MTPEACAALLLEVTPLVMRTIRTHMRGQRAADLSVPQFRALGFVHRHPGASLSDLAEHIGLTLPATSRMVDGLVARQYVLRQLSSADRRSVALTLSAKGKTMLDTTRQGTLSHLTELVAGLTPEERSEIARSLEALRGVFAPGRALRGGHEQTAASEMRVERNEGDQGDE